MAEGVDEVSITSLRWREKGKPFAGTDSLVI